MTTTKTKDVESTLSQIYELASNGADIVRVTCNEVDAATGLVEITQRSPVPIVADVHFQYKLALAAIDAGVNGLRLNPGNIRKEQQIKEVAKEALSASIPIRIGVNGGSLDKDLLMNAYQRVKNSEKTYTQIANQLSTIANEFGKEAILRASIKIISEDKTVTKNELEMLFDLSESLQIPRAYVRGIFIEEEIISK